MKKIAFPKRQPVEPQNAWEAGFGKLMTPLERFVKGETNSGILLVICTVIALFIANSPLFHTYETLLASYWHLGTPGFEIKMSLHHWINDGLMTLFFFLVGLEIKREVLVGELSNFRNALLPICAALGGMVVPAALYFSLNTSGVGVSGWGIPMATDIAFAVTALVLLGTRCPKSLMTFLIALAIVDDIGAVLVIAIFYTHDLHVTSLLWAMATFGAMLLISLMGVRRLWVYFIFGVALWIFMHNSGIHATIAGILAAMTIPSRPQYRPKVFLEGANELLKRFEEKRNEDKNILRNLGMAATLQTLENGINKAQTPLQNLEHGHHLPVNFLVIPLFALANAAIPIDKATLGEVFTDTVTLGVMVGLVLGKPIGIVFATWFAVKSGLCQMPKNVNMHHIVGAGLLAGIGFTMSIFIAELAFSGDNISLIHAKTGILFASVGAAILGFSYLWLIDRRYKKEHL